MCPRRLLRGLCFVLLVSGCGSTPPESLALVVEPTAVRETADIQAAARGVELPSGTTAADLPEALDDRLELMTMWLRGFEPAKNSGNEPIVVLEDGAVHAHFLVRTTDPTEAEGLCDIYSAAIDLYKGDDVKRAQLTLSGWVISEAGVLFDPGWDTISCQR